MSPSNLTELDTGLELRSEDVSGRSAFAPGVPAAASEFSLALVGGVTLRSPSRPLPPATLRSTGADLSPG